MYQEVGEVDELTLEILGEIVAEGSWVEWREGDRYYDIMHLQPEDIAELLPVFGESIQQFFLRIPPGGRVHKHVDRRKGHTYHIPVQTNPDAKSYMHTKKGTTEYFLEKGKIYYVDRSVMHSSQNLGDNARIHLLVEVNGRLE